MMLTYTRTGSHNNDFISLVSFLDADLAIRDGEDHPFYDQFNKLDDINHVLVAYEGDDAVACGAMKPLSGEAMEIKRMYTLPGYRGQGIAATLLSHLEKWAASLGYKKCLLETGIRQPEAIALYEKMKYKRISNYDQYAGIDTSVCFGKEI
ncbi:MAG: GNAT family N-acetyltransferase [Ferruginibacter sp.]